MSGYCRHGIYSAEDQCLDCLDDAGPLTLDQAYELGYERAVQDIVEFISPENDRTEPFSDNGHVFGLMPHIEKHLSNCIKSKFSTEEG